MKSCFLNRIDTERLIAESYKKNSKAVKRKYIKLGYIFQLSVYGATSDRKTGEVKGMRVEILAKHLYSADDLRDIYFFLMQFIPMYTYSIFIYDNDKGDLNLVGKYT